MVAFFAILMMSSVTGTVAAAEVTSDVEIHNSTRSNRGAVVGDGGEITSHIITRKIPTGVGGEENGTDVLAHVLIKKIPTGVDGGENGTDVKAHILIRKIPTGVDGGDDDEEITIHILTKKIPTSSGDDGEDPRERGGIYTTKEECEAAGGKWVVKKGFDHGFCFIRLGVSSDTF